MGNVSKPLRRSFWLIATPAVLLSALGCSGTGTTPDTAPADDSSTPDAAQTGTDASAQAAEHDAAAETSAETSSEPVVDSDGSTLDGLVDATPDAWILDLSDGSTADVPQAASGDDASAAASVQGSADALVEATRATDGGSQDGTSDNVPDADAVRDSAIGTPNDDGSDGAVAVLDASDARPIDATAPPPASDASDARAQCAPFDTSNLDDAAVYAGFQSVVNIYHCYKCHQDLALHPVDDAGRGIVLSGNNGGVDNGAAFPPNLTNDPTTGLGCWTNQQIQNAVLSGIDNEGHKLCPPMPLWGQAGSRPGTPMSAATAQQIIAFLRSLPPVVNQVPPTNCDN